MFPLVDNIGTGPGVIQADGFLSGYSMNMGRRGSQPTPGEWLFPFSNVRLFQFFLGIILISCI